MRKILIIGAGKSTSVLVKYFQDKSISENLYITIGDISIETIVSFSAKSDNGFTDELAIDVAKEVANVALFLASEYSSYINGQDLKVDGQIKTFY